MSATLPVFVYGTLRTAQDDESVYGLSMHGFDPFARQIGERGRWIVMDHALYGNHGGIPAATPQEHAHIIGDLYEVTIRGLRRLLHYESFPSFYSFDEVTARNLDSDTDRRPALMFTCVDAPHFGPHIVNGDYFAPSYQEVPVC